MSNYNQQTGSGESWQRCHSVRIENPLAGSPLVYFYEEVVVKVGTNIINKPNTACSKVFNAEETFDLLDVNTGAATGQTMTHQQLYQALYSLYIKTAMARDSEASNSNGSNYETGPF